MKWEMLTLGDISESIQTGPFGSQLHQSDYSESGTPVVMPKDLINGRISTESIARVAENHVERLSRHKILPGDILYSRRGDVGRCAFSTEKEAGWLCGTGCLRVTIDREKANPKFIFYQLQTAKSIGWVEKHAVGATMLNLNMGILGAVPVALPSLNTQNRIVEILSAYDDLIENNQKQIKLLEEAAQRLYKEWFIDLRFPGYKNTPVHDGVPEGWILGTLGQIVEFKRGQTITKTQVQEGAVPVVAGGLEPAYYHNRANTSAPVITVSGSGANAGFTRMYHTDIFASDCSFADKKATSFLEYAFCSLQEKKVELKGMQKGSAQPHVYAKDINSLPVLIPDRRTLDLFCGITGQMFEKSGVTEKQNSSLSQARDRLLPKLMSGEIEV